MVEVILIATAVSPMTGSLAGGRPEMAAAGPRDPGGMAFLAVVFPGGRATARPTHMERVGITDHQVAIAVLQMTAGRQGKDLGAVTHTEPGISLGT